MSFNDEFDDLAARRKKYLDGLDANKGEIDLDIFEDFYPDRAHFIFELLQNAEDACAENATFALTQGRCLFAHDGEPFTMDDIQSITGIHNSTKDTKPDKIGQFGIGFKSVFAYTRSPEIHFGDFAFKITRLVMPERVRVADELGNSIRFGLPFNHPKKPDQDAYAEIKAALDALPETTLLFLSNLRSLTWRIGDLAAVEVERVSHPDNHVEVRKTVDGKVAASSHFLLFDRPVEGLKKRRLAVAFPLDFLPKARRFNREKPLTEQMRITPANPGRVAVYFPAEKETSGLRFHLHAPFVPELSRASVKDTPANEPLFQHLASLTAASLHNIRKLGLLNAGFLEVLPNPQDDLPDRYGCIRDAIVDAMNNQPLTPTHSGKHAPASRLLQARASLKELLSEKDIAFLVGCAGEAKQSPKWAINVTQNPRIDGFLVGLDIRNWDVAEFVERLRDCTADGGVPSRRAPFYEWLRKKPPRWHQQLYALLYGELSRRGYPQFDYLKTCQIVLLGKGCYSKGDRCFFPDDSTDDDQMPRVDRRVYTSGKHKKQQDAARTFLQKIGVREVGEAEQVAAILERRYRRDSLDPSDEDLERFVALVEKEPHRGKMFAEYVIFEGADGLWRQPCQVFLDKPFLDTGLNAYYQVFGDDAKSALAPRYNECGISVLRLRQLAKAVGVQHVLEFTRVGCRNNPDWTYLSNVPGERRTWMHDSDFIIRRLDAALAQPSVELSRLIWRTLCELRTDAEEWQAMYRKNAANGHRTSDSQFLHLLKDCAWVPQQNGTFVRPKDAARELLPEGFPIDEGYEWLRKVHFGEANRQAAEESRAKEKESLEKEAVAKDLGFHDAKTLERAQQFATLPQGEQEWLLAESQRRQLHELPRHEPRNPDRRAERVRQEAANAPLKTVEERTRSVSLGRDDIKKHTEPYLQEQYTIDGEMICQLCGAALPFKLDDGKWFFEKVEFLADLTKHHHQNYLALCPNHAAMFLYANGSKDSLRSTFLLMTEHRLKIVLARQDATVYFTETHAGDIRAAIDAEQVR